MAETEETPTGALPRARMVALYLLAPASFALVAAIVVISAFVRVEPDAKIVLMGAMQGLLAILTTLCGYFFGSSEKANAPPANSPPSAPSSQTQT